jgi:tRNA threonylcarbamoyladenosine biosynthesis protein TsaE
MVSPAPRVMLPSAPNAKPPPSSRAFALPDADATARLAASVARAARLGDAILLSGPLGAGKTTFARAFLRSASGEPALEVPSPTFTLVQSYDTPIGTVHHYDLWRLDGPAALTELGWEDARDGIVIVEWPDRLGGEAPRDALSITLSMDQGDVRHATLLGWPDRLETFA